MPTEIVVHVTQHVSSLQSALPIAATAIAALAAGASWRSALLARRSQADADQPQLVWHIRVSDSSLLPGYPLTLSIENVGRGVAILPGFLVLSGEGAGVSHIIDRNLAHGDLARFGLTFNTTERAAGIAFCEDRNNNVHVWSAKRAYRRYKPSKRRNLTARLMLEAMYPGRGQELDAANLVSAQPVAD